jgi:LysR family hydrogen peroxide-inducible transcriptional activator
MTPIPTLRQLQFFAALAETGSFREAAARVGVTQPALSAAIKELENLAGAQLVERNSKGCTLTAAGEQTLTRAQRMLSDAEDLVQAARGAGAPLSGPVTLGVIPSIAPFLLPRALPELARRFPRLELNLREDITGRLLEALRDRTLDLAIIALPYDTPGIEAEPAFADEFLLIAPPDHPLLKRKKLSVDDVPEEELLLLQDGHCLRDHVLDACRAASGSRREFGATSLQTLTEMVAAGYGLTLAPRLMTPPGPVAGGRVQARAFEPKLVGREVGVAWRKGGVRERDGHLLAAALKEIHALP